MVDLQNIGTETSLAELYPKIDAFYENDLKHHRIHVSDNLFLSALELEAPAGSPGTSLQDSSNTLVSLLWCFMTPISVILKDSCTIVWI